MLQHWSTERAPVMIFLSDGECSISDRVIQDICRSAIQHGKPLSFHSVSFGKDASAAPLRHQDGGSRAGCTERRPSWCPACRRGERPLLFLYCPRYDTADGNILMHCGVIEEATGFVDALSIHSPPSTRHGGVLAFCNKALC
ncbi:hypothetical protein BC826DRAFT_1126017 [Russula brevipes]|nr:hypothetical protein BC826DRAFT_1126017 [Russula brevipes]